jgi:hypothetical protein
MGDADLLPRELSPVMVLENERMRLQLGLKIFDLLL